MPRISPLAKASLAAAACAELGTSATSELNLAARMKSTYSGFGEGVCTCARCMRRAGPIREDVENKLVQITYALANVYDDSPDLEVRVTDEHRVRAEEMMACVESGDVTHLREAFLEIEEQEAEGALEGGTATEIATYLIISAAQVGQPEVIRLLAEWDADMEETDSIRRGRPLMHAANNGHTAAVKALVECGADPEATDDNGYTALMVAVFSDRSSAAEALVDGGACVDAQDRAGRTALSYAAMYGSTDCIYLLAARGADVAHIDHDGNTPLELAEGSGRQSAVDALKKLQLRVKMQEKRKVKQSKCRSGCSDLDAAQLQAKEQEAARAAAELLEQLEKEEAAKSAKAAKKKKKGKGKAAAQDCASSDTTEPQQEVAADMLATAVDSGMQQEQEQQRPASATRQRSRHQQHQQPPNNSQDSTATAGWPSQERRAEHDDSAASRASFEAKQHQQPQLPRKQPKQAPAASPGGTASKQASTSHTANGVPAAHEAQHNSGSPRGDVLSSTDAASSVDGGCPESPVCDELDVLRRDWEALLELAARCRDQAQQPTMLARVAEMLPRCSDAGISVKYGRKVLQRLQAVGPARTALQAALAAQACSVDELESALGACKSCRCLLEDNLLQCAEDMLANLLKEQEEMNLQKQAQQQQQQQQPAWDASTAGPDSTDAGQHQVTAGLSLFQPLPQQLQQEHVQLQAQQHQHQVQQPRTPLTQQQQQVQLPQLTQPVAQQVLRQPQPQLQPPQHHTLPQVQQQVLQHSVQQQQQQQPPHPLPQHQQQPHMGLQPPGTTMPFLQQQLRALQPQQHTVQQQQQQQMDRQLRQSPLQQLLAQPQHGTPVSNALPVPSLLANQQQQQQQHSLSQLQLLQQQQLFVSQMQGGQLQRQMAPGMFQNAAPVGTSPGMLSPGLLSHQLLTPVSQAAVRMQQQQQLAASSSFWASPSLVAPGSFGSVGQPVARSSGGRLSLELLSQQSGIPCTAGLSAAAGELVRRNSLSTPVAVVAPVLLSGQADADVLDDHQHPAYAMANALLSDDERDTGNQVLECRVCMKARSNTCCLPCGCLLMCQGCALHWKQQGHGVCPFCKQQLEDFAVVS